MKKLLICLILGILLVSTISAFEFDNVKSFEKGDLKYGKITLKNSFLGVPTSTIEELTLVDNTDKCLISCYAEKEIVMYTKGSLIDGIKFNKLNGRETSIENYRFLIKTGSHQIDVNDYGTICSKGKFISENNTYENLCEYKIVGTHKEEVNDYVPYVLGTEVNTGTYYVRLEGTKREKQTVDWIIQSQGKWLDEWAVWTGESETVFSNYSYASEGDNSQTLWYGMGIEMNKTVTLINATKNTGSTVTRARVWNSSGYLLDTATVSGNTFDFGSDTILEKGKLYFFGGDASGASYTHKQMQTISLNESSHLAFAGGATEAGGFVVSGDIIHEFLTITTSSTGLVTLNSPIQNKTTITSSNVVNCSAIQGNSNITNMSLWTNQSGTWKIENYTLNLNGTENSSIWNHNFGEITGGKSILWSCQACDEDDDCGMANENRTLIMLNLIENSTSFNTSTWESKAENFLLNMSYNPLVYSSTSTNLVYNGTKYSGTLSGGSGEAQYTRSLNIPLTATQNIPENRSFYWEIALTNATATTYENSTTSYQYVNPIIFNLCNATNNVSYLNLTFKDESDSSSINAQIPTSNFIYYLSSVSLNRTLTFINTTENPSYNFCFSPSHLNVNVDSYIQYKNSTSYPQRIYDPSVTSYSNQTTNLTLYLTNTDDGIYVTFTVYSATGTQISGVNVLGTRVIGSTTTTVASGTTDASGSITFWLNPDFSHTFTFTKTGYDVYTTTLTPTQSTYTITLGGGSTGSPPADYGEGIGITIKPITSFISSDTSYGFNYTITTGTWLLDSWGFALKYGNGTIIGTQTSTVDTGGILNINVDTYNSTRIIMDYYYIINSTSLNGTKIWQVSKTSDYSLTHFFTRFSTYVDANMLGILGEDGTDYFGKALISVLVLVLVVGTLGYRYGIASEPAILGIIFGIVLFLNNVGFIPNPDFLVDSAVTLGDFIVYLTGVLMIGFVIKGEMS